MNHFTTLLIRNLLNNEHNLPEFESVLSEVFRQQLEEAVNDVLNYELEQFLGYERYRHTDKTDSRNGFKPDRTIDTKYGPITIKMPRDRLGLFASSLTPAYGDVQKVRKDPSSTFLTWDSQTVRSLRQLIECLAPRSQRVLSLTSQTESYPTSIHSRIALWQANMP